MTRFLIVAGDPSGDLLASQLVFALKHRSPGVTVDGIGGQRLRAAADRFLADIVCENALGFVLSPRQIFFFRRIFKDVIEPELTNNPPDAVIAVDFFGFNSHVAKAAKRAGRRVFYYACPQFWASRPGRAEGLRGVVDLFLCLFPFEAEFYRRRDLPATFVGHPVLDTLPVMPANPPTRIEPVIGLLPGSRLQEIRRHLPIMAAVCDRIAASTPGVRFLLFTVPNVDRNEYQQIISRERRSRVLIELVQDEDYHWRSQLDLAISASGMETLENALLGIPMVIMYKTNWVTYWIARALIRIKFLGMPNLLADRGVVPEFIQGRATVENIAKPIADWIADPAARNAVRRELLALRSQMGEVGAADRAAQAILEGAA